MLTIVIIITKFYNANILEKNRAQMPKYYSLGNFIVQSKCKIHQQIIGCKINSNVCHFNTIKLNFYKHYYQLRYSD